MNKILVLHLSSGEDIIGKARLDDHGSNWLVEGAVRPNIMMDPESGRARIALVPVIPYGEIDDLTISISHVLYTATVSEQMEIAYRQMTSSILTPSAAVTPGGMSALKSLLHS